MLSKILVIALGGSMALDQIGSEDISMYNHLLEHLNRTNDQTS